MMNIQQQQTNNEFLKDNESLDKCLKLLIKNNDNNINKIFISEKFNDNEKFFIKIIIIFFILYNDKNNNKVNYYQLEKYIESQYQNIIKENYKDTIKKLKEQNLINDIIPQFNFDLIEKNLLEKINYYELFKEFQNGYTKLLKLFDNNNEIKICINETYMVFMSKNAKIVNTKDKCTQFNKFNTIIDIIIKDHLSHTIIYNELKEIKFDIEHFENDILNQKLEKLHKDLLLINENL